MSTFYNTISLDGEELERAKENCKSQEERLQLLIDLNQPVTPLEAHELYEKHFPKVPITSIRRALHNLTSMNLFQKMDKLIDERYGKPNHKWIRVV